MTYEKIAMARSNSPTLFKIPPCIKHSRKCPSLTRVKRQKGRVTEQRMANVQISRTVEVVKACQPHKPATITRGQICFRENFHCHAY